MGRTILNIYLLMGENLNNHGDIRVTLAIVALERKIALRKNPTHPAFAAGW